MTAWYLTQQGRTEFAAKVAVRDENPYRRCNRLAEAAKRKKQEESDGWWRDAGKWIGLEVDHDPTMTLALHNLARQCPNWDEAVAVEEASRVNWQSEWRGVDWQHLDELAQDAAARAVIEEAKQVLQKSLHLSADFV